MFKNWMTTFAGMATALGAALSQQEDATLKAIGQILVIIGPLLLGIMAKDNNVTGGTREQ